MHGIWNMFSTCFFLAVHVIIMQEWVRLGHEQAEYWIGSVRRSACRELHPKTLQLIHKTWKKTFKKLINIIFHHKFCLVLFPSKGAYELEKDDSSFRIVFYVKHLESKSSDVRKSFNRPYTVTMKSWPLSNLLTHKAVFFRGASFPKQNQGSEKN